MFALIIAVVAIILIIVITMATQYYAGDLSSEAAQEAEVAKALNELSQIKGAVVAYNSFTGEQPESISQLVPEYLAALPQGWGVADNPLAFESKQVLNGTQEVVRTTCELVNKRLGMTGEPPSCTELQKGFYGCCVLEAAGDVEEESSEP